MQSGEQLAAPLSLPKMNNKINKNKNNKKTKQSCHLANGIINDAIEEK